MNSRPREYDRWHLRYSMLEIQLNCHRRCQTLHIAGIENGRIILEEVKVEETEAGAAGAAGNILEGNYIIYQNEWRKCGSNIGLKANHAYLVMDNVPTAINTRAIEKSVKYSHSMVK